MIRNSKNRAQAPAEATEQIVTFQVGAESFGLDIRAITEVIRPLPLTPFPHMPQFVKGVINLRGTIIPVVDLRERFGLADVKNNPRTMRMIITRGALPGRAAGAVRLLGLVVDSVQEVLDIPFSSIGPAPEDAMSARAEFIAGVAKVADRLIILLDIGRVLSGEERTVLAEAGNVSA
jgi:purine-binding chemotaxis protein CheW